MSTFDAAIPIILAHECPTPVAPVGGGWVNDSRDPGGCTVYGLSTLIITRDGITAADLGIPDLAPQTLKLVTVDAAKAIYRRLFWDRYHYEAISDQTKATKVFDVAVNCGPGNAARLAQRACGDTEFPVDVDGILGERSYEAINASEQQPWMDAMCRRQAAYQGSIPAHRPA